VTDRRATSPLVRLAERLRDAEEARPAFVEGLFLGAMVGAAIAGSTLWSRWRQGASRRSGIDLRSDRNIDSRKAPVASSRTVQPPIEASEARSDD
jgi:hypothetical protein